MIRRALSDREASIEKLRSQQKELQEKLTEVTLLLAEAEADTTTREQELHRAIHRVLTSRPDGILGYMRLATAAGIPKIREVKDWIKRNPSLIKKVGAKYFSPD